MKDERATMKSWFLNVSLSVRGFGELLLFGTAGRTAAMCSLVSCCIEPSPHQRRGLGRSNLLCAWFPGEDPGLRFISSEGAAADGLKVGMEFSGSALMPEARLAQRRQGKRATLTCCFQAAVGSG